MLISKILDPDAYIYISIINPWPWCMYDAPIEWWTHIHDAAPWSMMQQIWLPTDERTDKFILRVGRVCLFGQQIWKLGVSRLWHHHVVIITMWSVDQSKNFSLGGGQVKGGWSGNFLHTLSLLSLDQQIIKRTSTRETVILNADIERPFLSQYRHFEVMDQNLDNYAVHLKTQSSEKSKKCNQCDYTSSRAGYLRTHLKMHSGEKSNKCNQCDYASYCVDNLTRHLKIHSGEKPNK